MVDLMNGLTLGIGLILVTRIAVDPAALEALVFGRKRRRVEIMSNSELEPRHTWNVGCYRVGITKDGKLVVAESDAVGNTYWLAPGEGHTLWGREDEVLGKELLKWVRGGKNEAREGTADA